MTSWIDLTGWTLIHFLWQGTLIAGAAALALRLLPTARARYALACGALATMLLAPGATAWMLSSEAARPRVPHAIAHSSLTPAETQASDAAAVTPAVGAVAATAGVTGLGAVGVAGVMPALVAAWLSGVMLLLARLAGGYWRIRDLHRGAFLAPVSRWQVTADVIARRLGLRRPVFMVDSAIVDTPTVIGWMRPIVLLPVAAMTNLAPGQIEAILAHELAHIRRHDFVVNLAQTFAETLLFYHPGVWWLSSRIRAEREHCCDDVAVDVCGDPVAYAAALTELAAWTLQQRPLAVAATSGPLLERVRRLLGLAAPARSSSGRLIAGIAVTVVLVAASVRAVSLVQAHGGQGSADPDRVHDDGRFGPPDLNRLVGFELLPGPPTWPTDDPRGARAWHVTIDAPSTSMPLIGFTGRSVIRQAYGLSTEPIVGAPAWLDELSLDVSAWSDATFVDGIADPQAVQAALRTMFEQRLGLVVHRERREFPVYALVLANADRTLGPQIKPSTSSCWDGKAPRPARFTGLCGVNDHFTGVTGERVTIAQFIDETIGHVRGSPLSPDLPVVDRTGLTGTYDLSVRYGFVPVAALGAAHYRLGRLLEPLGFRSLYTALPEQLGLTLERSTERFDVLVIDRIQQPAPSRSRDMARAGSIASLRGTARP